MPYLIKYKAPIFGMEQGHLDISEVGEEELTTVVDSLDDLDKYNATASSCESISNIVSIEEVSIKKIRKIK